VDSTKHEWSENIMFNSLVVVEFQLVTWEISYYLCLLMTVCLCS